MEQVSRTQAGTITFYGVIALLSFGLLPILVLWACTRKRPPAPTHRHQEQNEGP